MKNLLMVMSLLAATSCTVTQPPLPLPPPLVEATAITEPKPPPLAPPSPALFLDELPPDVEAAMDKYVASGKAPIIDKVKTSGFRIFPYGLSQAEVPCKAWSICDIELEPGEEVLALGAADTVRWAFEPMPEGPKDRRIMHVLVKPRDDLPIETGLVIGTNRRLYRIKLKSSPTLHSVNVKFYFPEDTVRRFNAAQRAHQQDQAHIAAKLPDVSIEQLDQNYRIEGEADFRPTWAANDQTRTYLKMPHGVATQGGPALFVEQDGKSALINYTPRQDYFVVHGVPDRIVLRRGVGGGAQEVTIVRGQ